MVGLLVGWLRGGRPRTLAEVRPRLWGLCLAAFALHHLLPLAVRGLRADGAVHALDAAVFYGVLAVFALANRALPGAYWLLAGAACNAAATLWAGGRMPVWTAALSRFSAGTQHALLAGQGATHVAMARPVGLGWLGDVLAVPAPLPPDVISPGDIAIAVGVAVFVGGAMAPQRRSRHSLPS